MRGVYPSIYIGLKGGVLAILGEDRAALPQHGSLPPPIEGVAERCRQGVIAPRGRPPFDEPSRHRLCVVGSRLDLDQPLMVLCTVWVELMDVSHVPLHKSASESAFW